MDPQKSRPVVGDIGTPTVFQCLRCSRRFKRLEHLKRHQLCHEAFKHFRCRVCGKTFSRNDILKRHSATHSEITQENATQLLEIELPKRRRACIGCARSRERCSKTLPCSRCSNKSLPCAYPDERAKANGNEPIVCVQESTALVSLNCSTIIGQSEIQPVQSPSAGNGEGSTVLGNEVTTLLTSTQPMEASSSGNNTHFFPHNYLLRRPDVYLNTGVATDTDFIDGPTATYDENCWNYPINWLPASEAIDNDSFMLSMILSSQVDQNSLESSTTSQEQRAHLAVNTVQSPAIESPMSSFAGSSSLTSSSSIRRDPDQVALGLNSRAVTRESLYATSTDGIRVPCTVRSRNKRPRPASIPNSQTLPLVSADTQLLKHSTEKCYRFSDLSHLSMSIRSKDGNSNQALEATTYTHIRQAFQDYCLGHHPSYPSFASTAFPLQDQLSYFVDLYFVYMAPILPIIYQPSFNINDYWPLTLAMAAIGCQYTQVQEFVSCTPAFHEFLRRLLASKLADAEDTTTRIQLLQALVLNQVGMLCYGHSALQSLALQRRSELLHYVQLEGLLRKSNDTEIDPSMPMATLREHETRRRLGYSIWWLDCIAVIQFGAEPTVSLAIAQADLPQDQFWAGSLESNNWPRISEGRTRNPSLQSAVQQIFRDKQVKEDLGEFSRILVLHGVYSEIFQIKQYCKRPLASWAPSAQIAEERESPEKNSHSNSGVQLEWLPGHPLFSSWRNAALDCIDTLHWAANATIALNAGAEHPTVMHLHVSRIILLVPFDDIITLAFSVMPVSHQKQGRKPSVKETLAAESQVLQWARRDETKARLAALHSGCLYWHVRRYSTLAFYEPYYVLLATLTLWAYSLYTSTRQSRMQGKGNVEKDGQGSLLQLSKDSAIVDPDLTFYHMDRPCDDEMVQEFVRHGGSNQFKAYITGVGDISAPAAPALLIQEGLRILDRVSLAWGRTMGHRNILKALEQVIPSQQPNTGN